MATEEMERVTVDAARGRAKAPIPSRVAALVSAFRAAFRKAEDEYHVQREGRRVVDTRSWTMDFNVKRDDEDGGFVAACPQLPGAMAQGETEQEALENLGEVVEGILYLRVKRRLKEWKLDATGLEDSATITISLP